MVLTVLLGFALVVAAWRLEADIAKQEQPPESGGCSESELGTGPETELRFRSRAA